MPVRALNVSYCSGFSDTRTGTMADRPSVRVSEKAQGLTRGLQGSSMGNLAGPSMHGQGRHDTWAARWPAGPAFFGAIEAAETVDAAAETQILSS